MPHNWLVTLADLLRALTGEARAEGPVYVYEAPGRPDLPAHFAYPVRLQCCGPPVRDEPHLGAALSPLLATETEARRIREARQRLMGAASAQLRDVERRLADWRARARKAEAAEEDRRIGELLLAQPHAASPHADAVELVDYFAEGTPTITVALDPPGNAPATAAGHFARYKRARRLLTRLPPLIEEGESESRYLESVLGEVEFAEELDDLATIQDELTEQGYLRAKQTARATPRRRPRGQGEAPKLHTTTSSDGYPVLYGTNHLQNEELVRLAAPDDIWLHVQGAPGAHVLVRTDGQPEKVPQTTLLEAARVAARWSRLRNQGAIDVDYTLAKHVRKAKGKRPGMVYYTHQKTVTVAL